MATAPDRAPADRPGDAPDNMLGVCAALAEITGVAPLVFRIAFLVAMLAASPELTIGIYFIAAAAFFLARCEGRPAEPQSRHPSRTD